MANPSYYFNLHLIGYAALCTYFVGLLFITTKIIQRSPISKKIAILPGLAGAVPHTFLTYHLLVTPEGINLGIFPMMALVSLVIMLASLYLCKKQPVETLMVIVYPINILLLLISLLFKSQYLPKDSIPSGILSHIFFSILAYSAFMVAFAQSLMVYAQNLLLKRKQLTGVIQLLPPLQLMEQILFSIISSGLFLLTLAILSGIIFLENIFAQSLAHKSFFSLIAWFIFSGLLLGRHRKGWRGFTAVRWTMGGFSALLLAFVGTKFVLEILLS